MQDTHVEEPPGEVVTVTWGKPVSVVASVAEVGDPDSMSFFVDPDFDAAIVAKHGEPCDEHRDRATQPRLEPPPLVHQVCVAADTRAVQEDLVSDLSDIDADDAAAARGTDGLIEGADPKIACEVVTGASREHCQGNADVPSGASPGVHGAVAAHDAQRPALRSGILHGTVDLAGPVANVDHRSG